jgi:acetyl esterase/lipase
MAHADDEALLDHLDARRLMTDMRSLTPRDEERAARLVATDLEAPGLHGAPPVPLRMYRRHDATGLVGVIVSIHGGAFVAGSYDDMRAADEGLADHLGCAVIAVEYRLAPEHRYPAAAEDCYAALCWVAANAERLAIDPHAIIVYGGSAGGALAASVALRARDEHGPALRAQVLMIPVIHDRLDTASTVQMPDNPGFSGNGARGMWALYLGEIDRARTPHYAAPGRATELAGLPPAYIRVHGRDPLRDEGIEYASRLMAAGVEVELHCMPGMFHGAPARDARVEIRANRELLEVLAAFLSPAAT